MIDVGSKYKEIGVDKLFGERFRLAKISKHGDPHKRLNADINWQFATG